MSPDSGFWQRAIEACRCREAYRFAGGIKRGQINLRLKLSL